MQQPTCSKIYNHIEQPAVKPLSELPHLNRTICNERRKNSLWNSGFQVEQLKLGAMAIGPLYRSALGMNSASQTGCKVFAGEFH
jgi:hypothetical protein